MLFPESGDAAATASPVRRQNWPQLQASLENGESRPNDWIIADAQGRLSHWIQSLDWRGGVQAQVRREAEDSDEFEVRFGLELLIMCLWMARRCVCCSRPRPSASRPSSVFTRR